MFAIIESGGKQHVVEEGRWFQTEKLDQEEGSAVEFAPLLVADDEGKSVKVGTPTVSGAKVIGKIMEHGREKKIAVIKFKAKSNYRRNVGHRQPYTKVLIEKIVA
ncbi:MAG: 50S ribosomal protein L21 [Patescibacteria group bacterium]